ncbi:hypothetical protein [Halopiger thermotolerans]
MGDRDTQRLVPRSLADQFPRVRTGDPNVVPPAQSKGVSTYGGP